MARRKGSSPAWSAANVCGASSAFRPARAEVCYAVHAEQNALIQAARMGVSVYGATMYVTYSPCIICARLLINAGIVRVIYRYDYPDEFSREILKEAGVELIKFDPDAEIVNE